MTHVQDAHKCRSRQPSGCWRFDSSLVQFLMARAQFETLWWLIPPLQVAKSLCGIFAQLEKKPQVLRLRKRPKVGGERGIPKGMARNANLQVPQPLTGLWVGRIEAGREAGCKSLIVGPGGHWVTGTQMSDKRLIPCQQRQRYQTQIAFC